MKLSDEVLKWLSVCVTVPRQRLYFGSSRRRRPVQWSWWKICVISMVWVSGYWKCEESGGVLWVGGAVTRRSVCLSVCQCAEVTCCRRGAVFDLSSSILTPRTRSRSPATMSLKSATTTSSPLQVRHHSDTHRRLPRHDTRQRRRCERHKSEMMKYIDLCTR